MSRVYLIPPHTQQRVNETELTTDINTVVKEGIKNKWQGKMGGIKK
jgi:hypothetical protein